MKLLNKHKKTMTYLGLNESKDFFCYAAFPILNELEKITQTAFNRGSSKFSWFHVLS